MRVTLQHALSPTFLTMKCVVENGYTLTIDHVLDGYEVVPRSLEKARLFVIDFLRDDTEIMMYVPETLVPQVIGAVPQSPIPGYVGVVSVEETVAMKLQQQGYLRKERHTH